jgi:hypothetical protein
VSLAVPGALTRGWNGLTRVQGDTKFEQILEIVDAFYF